MKLATLKNQTRDGLLVVVNRDLSQCIQVPQIAASLQDALDRWDDVELHLKEVYSQLNENSIEGNQPFVQSDCESPLPRSYQWADGSAYLNHVELVRKARGAEVPASFWHDPLVYQGGSDSFLGPYADIPLADESWGIDFEGEVAVITDDVPMGIGSAATEKHIKLVMLVNDVSLRNLIPNELGKGFGFFQSKPSTVFSPVCVTPDELGDSWSEGKLHEVLCIDYNNEPFGRTNTGEEMTFSFQDLISHCAKSRPLSAGTIVGSGTVSNKLDGGPGLPVSEGGRGYSCIAEIRMIEKIYHSESTTDFMKFNDQVSIEVKNALGQSIFGRIDQKIVKYIPE